MPFLCASGRAGVPGADDDDAAGGRDAFSRCRVLIGNFVLWEMEIIMRKGA